VHGVNSAGQPGSVKPGAAHDTLGELLAALPPCEIGPGGVLWRAPLGTAVPGARPHGAADCAEVRHALPHERLDERIALYDRYIQALAKDDARPGS
jgi:hypothetical protein